MKNKKVIIRGERSGIFFGTIVERNGREVKLSNCRRLWYWSGAASISQLAVDGTVKPNDCKFTESDKPVTLGWPLSALEFWMLKEAHPSFFIPPKNGWLASSSAFSSADTFIYFRKVDSLECPVIFIIEIVGTPAL